MLKSKGNSTRKKASEGISYIDVDVEPMVGQALKVRSSCYLEYRTLSNGQKLNRKGGELKPTRIMEELCPRDRKKIILAPQDPRK